jgi:hypothetical protein
MAGPKGSKYNEIFLRHQVQLVTVKDIIRTFFRIINSIADKK